jgi:hypothetical protein
MPEGSTEWSEIQGAARELWEAMNDPITPTAESPAAATIRAEFRRLSDEGRSEDEIAEVIGGEILRLAGNSD